MTMKITQNEAFNQRECFRDYNLLKRWGHIFVMLLSPQTITHIPSNLKKITLKVYPITKEHFPSNLSRYYLEDAKSCSKDLHHLQTIITYKNKAQQPTMSFSPSSIALYIIRQDDLFLWSPKRLRKNLTQEKKSAWQENYVWTEVKKRTPLKPSTVFSCMHSVACGGKFCFITK